MTRLSTHVLDTARGGPAVGVRVSVHDAAGNLLGEACTDSDGRIGTLVADLPAGRHTIGFATGEYLATDEPFLTGVSLTVCTTTDAEHYHLPLLLSPYGCTLYRGT